jgi:putative hydrolase of the HAD superfamily
MPPQPSRANAVLFDALGTLVELEPPWPFLRQLLRQRHGIEVDEARAREAMLAEMSYYRQHHIEGHDESSLLDLRRRCAGVLREQLPELSHIDDDRMTDLLLESLRFTPYPDAASTLAALRQVGLRSAVVSNWDRSLHEVLASVGLSGAVDAVVVSAEVGAAKPDAEIFRAALERVHSSPERALFVGDSLETDVAGARGAGLRAVLLDRNDSVAAGDVEKIFSLTDLLSLVLAPSG